MKVQCQCGAKYSIDATPEMARDPVRFICPGCGVDLSGPINDLVRQELGLAAAAPSPAPAHAAVPHAPMRVSLAPPAPTASAAPARLSISKSASTATHGTATADAPPPAAESGDAQSCVKHKGEIIVEHCYVCRKPLCPKCMELFGYVCSPLCAAKASSHGINVPVFAGQKSVREARQWRKTGLIGAAIVAAVALILGGWIWYAWIGSVPHPIFSVRFPEPSYAGSSRLVANDQIVFLHGGLLARYKLGSKTAIWTNEIISQAGLDAEIDHQMNEYIARLNAAIKRGADSESRPHVPLREELAKAVQEEMEISLNLFVQDKKIWIARDGRLTPYDWETGKAGEGLTLPPGGEARRSGSDLQVTDENAFGQHVVTHVDLASGESHTEEIGEPRQSAVLASGQKPTPTRAGNKSGKAGAGLPTQPGSADANQPLDPGKVAQDAQSLPYAAKVALPATLSNTRHQEQILKEIKEDEAPEDSREVAEAKHILGVASPSSRSFDSSPFGHVEWSSKMLEQRSVAIKAMKDKPAHSALENNPSVTNTSAIANEILNDMQRDRGGDVVSEDVSRYQVTVHNPDAKDVPDWVGEIIGPPWVIQQKTVTIVTGGKMFVVLDKSNKKLWQADLSYTLARGFDLHPDDQNEPSVGEGPCVEHDDALYAFDQASLTAYDLATGNVRWRVPTIGIRGLFFDDQGALYANSTTADLDTLRFSHQIDIDKKIEVSVLRIDGKTGKIFWSVKPGGLVSHVDGKFVFCYASHQAPDLDPDSLTTLPGMLNSGMAIRRLDPKTGKIVWDYAERRAPLAVRFNGNLIELVFRKEVEVLKFITF